MGIFLSYVEEAVSRSQVLARNSQSSHCDWPVWLQQVLVLPMPRAHTLGGWHIFHVLLHPHF